MSTVRKMIITGANGFIGSALVKHFRSKDWEVIAFVPTMPDKPLSEVVYVKFSLGKPVDKGAFADVEALIHCAYIKNDLEQNINGTRELMEQSRKAGVKRNIFLSSFSAHKDAVSKYGKQKLSIEGMFNTAADCVIRAGVVLGDGGLFKQMSEHIRKGKRIPLIDGGKQPFQTIHIDDLVGITEKVIERNISGTYTVAEPQPVPYKEFFVALAQKLNVSAKFVRVPFFLVNFALIIAEGIGMKLPIARENVLGLKFIRQRETAADLEKLGVPIRNYKESLKTL